MRARRRTTALAAVVVALLLLGGCGIGDTGGDLPQNALDPSAGSPALEADRLWDLVFPIAVGVFVLVQTLILVAVFRFRQRKDDDPRQLPKQVPGNTKLEVLWTVIPAVILVFVAIPTVQTIFSLAEVDEDAMNVRVIGKQYWWEFEYMDPEQGGVVTATQLHIPTGREVELHMQSVAVTQSSSYNPADYPDGPTGEVAQGVMHNFWVPEIAPKTYVVPGHTRTMKLRTDDAGVYSGQCGEYCGLSHPNMRFSVVAQDPAEFDAWIEEQSEAAPVAEEGQAAEGQQLFTELTCVQCHAIEGYPANGDPDGEVVPIEDQARIGPNLTHFNARERFAGGILETESDDDLAAWLRNPQAEKPGAQMPNLQLRDDQIDALIAYMRTLE